MAGFVERTADALRQDGREGFGDIGNRHTHSAPGVRHSARDFCKIPPAALPARGPRLESDRRDSRPAQVVRHCNAACLSGVFDSCPAQLLYSALRRPSVSPWNLRWALTSSAGCAAASARPKYVFGLEGRFRVARSNSFERVLVQGQSASKPARTNKSVHATRRFLVVPVVGESLGGEIPFRHDLELIPADIGEVDAVSAVLEVERRVAVRVALQQPPSGLGVGRVLQKLK